MNSEEQYKHIEQKIIEAASVNEYAYSEEAWKRMELLLDKKDKKRRFFFWLLPLLLLLTVGGGIALYTNNGNKNSIASNQEVKESSASISSLPSTSPVDAKSKLEVTKDANVTPVTSSTIENGSEKKTEQLQPQNEQSNILSKQTTNTSRTPQSLNKYISPRNKKTKKQQATINNEEELYESNNANLSADKKAKVKITSPAMGEDIVATGNEEKEKEVVDEPKPLITNMEKNKVEENKQQEEAKVKATENKKEELATKKPDDKKSKKTQPNFFVLASLGAEANTTKLLSFSNTTIVPRYGAAIGYQFNNRLSVQAGFYVSGKKYVAQKRDYKFDANNYLANLDITKIDANCKVYEIPVSVQYNFINKPKLSVFGTVGVSSYIMKNEDYVYDYWYGSVYYSTPWTYTKNTHLLAAANFSIGIEKSISKKINLQLSPRISIPLGGVGEGKVKLFSSGIDFGIKYYPFKK